MGFMQRIGGAAVARAEARLGPALRQAWVGTLPLAVGRREEEGGVAIREWNRGTDGDATSGYELLGLLATVSDDGGGEDTLLSPMLLYANTAERHVSHRDDRLGTPCGRLKSGGVVKMKLEASLVRPLPHPAGASCSRSSPAKSPITPATVAIAVSRYRPPSSPRLAGVRKGNEAVVHTIVSCCSARTLLRPVESRVYDLPAIPDGIRMAKSVCCHANLASVSTIAMLPSSPQTLDASPFVLLAKPPARQ
jgi:hypothetical protein